MTVGPRGPTAGPDTFLRPGNLCPDHGEPLMLLCAQCKVSPGAAARRAPTDAMIAAAARALWETGNARIGFRAYTAALKQTYEREAEVALRAALAAARDGPA